MIVVVVIVIMVIAIKVVVIAALLAVPRVIVVDAATRTVPVALVEHAIVTVRRYPVGTLIRRACPIPVMPKVMSVTVGIGIPISTDPEKLRSRSGRPVLDSHRGRWADPEAERNLRAGNGPTAQQKARDQKRSDEISHCDFTSEWVAKPLELNQPSKRLRSDAQNDDT